MHQIYKEDEKINIAAMYLDKSICDWFLWWDLNVGRLVRDWVTFKNFFKQFQDMEEDKIYSKLTCLQQNVPVDE